MTCVVEARLKFLLDGVKFDFVLGQLPDLFESKSWLNDSSPADNGHVLYFAVFEVFQSIRTYLSESQLAWFS